MFRKSLSSVQRTARIAWRQAYSTNADQPSTTKAAAGLAEEALAQKTGGRKATLPKGDKKPAKAAGEKSNQWKSFALGAGAVTGGALGGLFYFGRPFDDGREDKYANENPLSAAYSRCIDRYNEFQQKMNEPMWDKLLPDPLPEPYRRPYTLVINLDETLIYSTWDKEHGWRHAKRPGVDYFLSYLSQFYEIIIFTSQPSANAFPILDKLDPYQYAMYRLYRESTRYVDGKFIKDLSHLNRDLSKVIIMDSNPEAFSLQPENGIPLTPWKGTPNDTGLLAYIPFLEAVALTNPEDVRPVLKSFEGKNIPIEWHKREEEMNERHRQQWYEEQAAKKTKRNLGSLFGSAAAPQVEGPPPTYLEQMRKHVRETFAAEHEQMKQQQDEMMKKEMEENMAKLKEMKLTMWDLMTQMSSGQPLLPPPEAGSDGSQQQQQPQQPQQ
ncbi:HAD-like domain-containing protein [Radiomyces spectabilis]|uniref:HAD-like domain-containing protein n=1 Tax=Radiomyces spectabilis TaxID=64574 RepID=UPI002220E413|nr:HAD-like domain-containing protein [Radiomyces spectabilis]KAI8384485.1 HAD-like domain-containing protein [Radiomyces spectabilis]